MTGQESFLETAVRRSNRRLLRLNLPFIVATIYGAATVRAAGHSESLLFIATSFFSAMMWPGAVVGFWNLRKYQLRERDPFLHPDFKPLRSYGDVHTVAAEAERSFRAGPWIVRNAFLIITPVWYGFSKKSGFDAFPVREIVWAYRLRSREKVNGIVVREGQSLIVRTGSGRSSGVNLGSQQAVEEVLRGLAAAAPWAEIGWSAELSEQWTRHRADFLARTDARRAQATSGGRPQEQAAN